MYALKVKKSNAFNQNIMRPPSTTVKATSDALADMETTAVTDRSC
jgi:hypothetical protein